MLFQCPMFNGQCSMLNVQRSMLNGQRSMVNGQRLAKAAVSETQNVFSEGVFVYYGENDYLCNMKL